ncbi:MAG: GntR family transcriptional regulator [Hyphomicrobiales bacterium]|nr:MAG: GntR family transcriptional regulator [Hyphomicrobiales bacterium]
MTKTKIETVYQTILRQIEQGKITSGTRLPSIRNAAEDFKVSKNTIVTVYDQLVVNGMVSAKQGAGFFVNSTKLKLAEVKPEHVKQASDIISLLRAQLEKDYLVRVGDGRPPASWMDDTIPKRSSPNAISAIKNDSSGYGSPYGYGALRDCIVTQHQALNLDISADQIVTTFGANHALDLIIRRYLSPGDTVLVDDPGYYPLFAKLKLSKINFVGVKRTLNGPDLKDLKNKAENLKPLLFFTQSTAQNPTGSSFDLRTAHSVLQIASQYNFLIVDDDPFIDLLSVKGTRLATLDGFNNVMFVGTYSKTLSASYRSGYIIAHPDIVASLAELKMITSVNSSRYSEIIIAEFINSRRYQKHLKKISNRVIEAANNVSNKLSDMGFELFTRNTFGYYLQLMLPPNISDLELAQNAAKKGIFLAPGSLFAVDSEKSLPSLRINVTRADDVRFYNFLKTNLLNYNS